MESIKLFTFITISLIPSIFSSTQCKNPELKCIELCCKETQYYEKVSGKCKGIPENGSILWDIALSEEIFEAKEFVEFDGCDMSGYISGFTEFCYSPYYNTDLKKFAKKYFYAVPCDRLNEIPIAKIVAALYVGTLCICLSVMVIYMCIKGLTENFIFKLFSWYLASKAGFLVAITAYLQYIPRLRFVATFFLCSSWLWLTVIGFQMWSSYKEANAGDISHNNQRRFICYCIFIWGISAVPASMDYWRERDSLSFFIRAKWVTMPELIEMGIITAVIVFNLVTFLVLAVDICITRCRVVNLMNETRFNFQLASIILRLCLMMGIPRIVVITCFLFASHQFVKNVLLTLEPFVLFIVLLWKPKNWNLIWCRNSEEISNAPEIVNIHTN